MAHKSIEANSLIIKDSKGRAVLTLGVHEVGDASYPSIELLDYRTQTCRVEIMIDSSGPFVAVKDESGLTVGHLRAFDDGRRVCGVYGGAGAPYAVSFIDPNGDPMFEVRDGKGEIVYTAPGQQDG